MLLCARTISIAAIILLLAGVPAHAEEGVCRDADTEVCVEGNQGKIHQGKIGQGKVNQGKVDQGKVNQGKVDQGKIGQGKVDQGKIDQGKIDQGTPPSYPNQTHQLHD